MKINHPIIKNPAALLLLLGISSCSVAKYQQPKAELPDNFRTTSESQFVQDSAVSNIAKIPYKDFFTDPTLRTLIESGIANNNDLQIAVKQIEIASLAYNQSKWGNIPTVNLNLGAASINRPSDNSLNGKTVGSFLGKTHLEDYSTAVNISWEADIWGKISSRKEAALASYLQTQEAAKAVQTQLISQIAQGYYNLLMLDMQMDITKQNLDLINNTLRMINVHKELGLTTSLSVQQQENSRDQLLATLPVIQQYITVQENTLSVLTGKMPGEIKRTSKLNDVNTPSYNSIGIPAEMLSYRPDIKSSELTVKQAFANVKITKANMYPALNITAQGGLNAFEFKNWFNIPGSLFGTAAGSLAMPLLNGKQLKTQHEQSKIAMEQAELNFKQNILNAVGEVSNVLATIESADQQEKTTSALVLRSGEAVTSSTKLFKQDMATYLDVINAQNNKLQDELSLANIKLQKLNAVVNLYRALGGGWN